MAAPKYWGDSLTSRSTRHRKTVIFLNSGRIILKEAVLFDPKSGTSRAEKHRFFIEKHRFFFSDVQPY